MARTMTASDKQISDGQIENIVDKFRAAVRKHRTEIAGEVAQQILGVENLGMELYTVVRKNAERFASMFSRLVTVDRVRSPQQALDATGRIQYTDASVVAAMPRGESTEELFFFKIGGGYVSDADLDREYELRGLKPASPYSLSAVNEADPAFADTHPNGTHWKDADGKWCFATFGRWHGRRYLSVHPRDDGWRDRWWFAGIRKS